MTGAPAVIVTGAGGQLGAAITRALVARGAGVVLVDLDAATLERHMRELPYGSATSVEADVTDPSVPQRVFDASMSMFGRIDAIVNNAGVEGPIDRIENIDLADVRRVFDVNVFALLAFSQEAMRRFRVQGHGRIVNMASGAGTAGSGLMTPYSASKHAAIGISRSLALEGAPVGIQVNAVCPGCVDSPMMERIEVRLGEIAGTAPVSFLDGIPAGRYCDPAEVAALVAWLVVDAPATINGTTQVIDGAMRA